MSLRQAALYFLSMDAIDTGTIASTEVRLKPLARWATCTCMALGAWQVACAAGALTLPAWCALALPYLLLTWCNLQFFRSTGATIGQVPLAVFSLTPAALASMLASVRGSALWWLSLTICAASCAVTALFCWWFWRLRHAYERNPEVMADAVIVVLGGLVRRGRPVPTVVARLEVARQLWEESPARRIVLTGGPTPDGLGTEAEAMAQWLTERGVPRDAMLLEPKAINTEENLVRTVELLEREGLSDRQLCVVSSDYHLYRARELARRHDIELVTVPALTPWRTRPQQWCREVMVILAKL